ncbi:MAG: hypothetical protein JNK60_09035, partial [Acidobacteria bacterium]|nr:hypothetical protein [Acidobacteriota bacterium]
TNVTSGAANVVFTSAPQGVALRAGQPASGAGTTFTLENIGDTAAEVTLVAESRGEAFFEIRDAGGAIATDVTLQPRTPQTFGVRFTGPSGTSAWDGSVSVVARAGRPRLPVTPGATVSLVTGSAAGDAAARFSINGIATEALAFPGLSGDDALRPPLEVTVENPGSQPVSFAYEIGPELWLEAEAGWNATPVPPGGRRTVRLFTRRSRAPEGASFPRETFLTLRTPGGATSRLLVRDNDAPAVQALRSPLPTSAISYIVPSVVNAISALGNTFVSTVQLTNAGGEGLATELVFTPQGASGWDAALVKRVKLDVPAHGSVRLRDPLGSLFLLAAPVSGQLEVRIPSGRAGELTVTASVEAPALGKGAYGLAIPVVRRGDGARLGRGHIVEGLVENAAFRSNLVLAETTGLDGARVRVTLVDTNGESRGQVETDVLAYSQTQISGIVSRIASGITLDGGHLELDVVSGGGTIAGLVTVIDNANDDATAWLGHARPVEEPGARTGLAAEDSTRSLSIPSIVSGYSTFPGLGLPYAFQTSLTFSSGTASTATFDVKFRDLVSGHEYVKRVEVPGRRTIIYADAVSGLFGLAAGSLAQGPVSISSSLNGTVQCRVFSLLEDGSLGDSFPVVAVPSEALTSAADARPLYLDGLEQSTDRSRGTRSNLILTEVLGKAATVTVRLYEASNRSDAIAEAMIPLPAHGKVQLSTVFAGLGLDSEERRKDRTNVLCVVTGTSGEGQAAAVMTTIDNQTGDTRNLLLTGSGATIGF